MADVLRQQQSYNEQLAARIRERERALPRPVRRTRKWYDFAGDDQGFSDRSTTREIGDMRNG